jgi:2-oxoglutarate dehydrogenase E2 component (dihydrolipoamide succinyltransferase)
MEAHMPIELVVPTAGESITEVQIGEWLKNEGDLVQRDEAVVELETDKASMELPAPASGVLVRLLKRRGDTANVGEVIGYIDEAGSAGQSRSAAKAPAPKKAPAPSPPPAVATAQAKAPPAQPVAQPPPPARPATPTREPHVMPAARRVLAEAGVAADEVAPTGPGGRVLKEDALRGVERQAASAPSDGAAPSVPLMTGTAERREEAQPMTMLRRRIAERLVEAQRNAALLTTFNEIDMSAVMSLRKQRNDDFQKRYGVKLGFMSFFVKASIEALKLIPQVNAEIRGADIVYKNYFDIGVAVGTDKGLVVPVIRNAERLSFAEIELAIGELAQRARDRKLSVDELQGGTFTISNGGVYGSLMSTPIVNPPQSGILGLHAIQDRPVARDGQVVIRPMMYVALSYDHRVVDGREAVSFLVAVKDRLEAPERLLVEV